MKWTGQEDAMDLAMRAESCCLPEPAEIHQYIVNMFAGIDAPKAVIPMKERGRDDLEEEHA